MPNPAKLFRSCALIAVLLLLPCKAYVCVDYPPEEWRFWLFQPDVAGLNELIPFTYSEEPFFGEGWELDQGSDSLNCLANNREWQAVIGGSATSKDIDKLLYQTDPDQFNSGKISPEENTFLSALQQPQYADLLAYMHFAKQCEHAMSGTQEIPDLEKARDAGRVLLPKITHPFAKLRTAYQLLKLNAYLGNEPGMREQFDFIRKNAAAGTWVRDRALYNYAVGQSNMDNQGRYDYWLSRAFDECRWNREWLIRCFRPKQVGKALEYTQNKHERAVLETMVALQYPGRALDRLRKVWAQDPQYPLLSLLLAREINKLENWILTPQLTGATVRVEMEYREAYRADRAELLRSDLEYLHKVLDFINNVVDSGKNPDPDFWRLSAAHLSLLDGDFDKTREQLKGVSSPDKLPARLLVQFKMTEILAELLDRKTITPETENKIPDVFALLEKEKGHVLRAGRLQSQLAIFLSNAFTQRGSVAKGALLLSKSRQGWRCPFGNDVFYYKLLETAKSADYDELLALLSRAPETPFERWLTADPIPFKYNRWDDEYDPVTGDLIPAKFPGDSWDLGVIREFKARYYLWQDQLDSACLVLNEVREKQQGHYRDDPEAHDNPFSVGIAIPGVALSGEDFDFQHDEVKFFKKILELKAAVQKDSADKQVNYLLLGNAYFNMSWIGRWWDVYHTNRYSGDFEDVRYTALSPARNSEKDTPFAPWSMGIGLLGLTLAGVFQGKRRHKIVLVCFACCSLAVFWNCNPSEPPKPRPPAWKPVVSAEFDAVYFCCDRANAYYIKAFEENPGTDVAIVAAYMIGLCRKAREGYEFRQTHPDDFYDDVPPAETVYSPNPYLGKLPPGKKFAPAVSCAVFRAYLEKEGR